MLSHFFFSLQERIREANLLSWHQALVYAAAPAADVAASSGAPTWITWVGLTVTVSGGLCQVYQTVLRHFEYHGKKRHEQGHAKPHGPGWRKRS